MDNLELPHIGLGYYDNMSELNFNLIKYFDYMYLNFDIPRFMFI